MNKSAFRKKMITIRKHVTGKKRANEQIAKKVMQLSLWKRAHSACVYKSFPNEVDTKKFTGKKYIVDPEHMNGKHVDLFIVPGVAFDKKGNRLGRGRGFYDRLLKGVTVPKIGLAYEIQMVAKVPVTSYDIPMDIVVTETMIYENKTS
jgi:5-formyltetrahydrofolate cyclo-ligase